MFYSLGCRASVLVELMIPTGPGKILCVPEAGAPWYMGEAAPWLAPHVNEAVLTEKITSTSRPQRIATFKHFSSWYSENTAPAMEEVSAGGNLSSLITTALPR